CGAGAWRGRLTSDQLRRLYLWFDSWGPFQSGAEQDQPGTAPVRLVFAGHGQAAPSPAERTAVADFAANLYRELAARHPAPISPMSPPPPLAQGKLAGKPAIKGSPAPPTPPAPAPEPAGPRALRPELPPAAHEPPPVAAPAIPPPAPTAAPPRPAPRR
ncbi:MAG: hypothetical protein QOJ16_2561, partial [Acidobacteriota bacterium]|nr:hypothetical protein [Acidobacteriota bacterium]